MRPFGAGGRHHRDSISAKAEWNGHQFLASRHCRRQNPEDDFELTIQEQITEAAAAADVIWVVVEAPVAPTEEDRRVARLALKSGKPVSLVINKVDQARGADLTLFDRLGVQPIVRGPLLSSAAGWISC